MTVIAMLKDGRLICATAIPRTPVASGAQALSATVTDLRKVEWILAVQLGADANVSVPVNGTSISGNAVGVTINPASGTTISGNFITLGY